METQLCKLGDICVYVCTRNTSYTSFMLGFWEGEFHKKNKHNVLYQDYTAAPNLN